MTKVSVFPPPDLEPDDQTQRQSKSRRLSSAIRVPATRPGTRRPDTETVKVQEAVVCYPCSRHQTWNQTTRHRDSQSPGGCRLLSVFPPPDLDPDDQTQRQSKSRRLSSAIRVPATRPGTRRPDTDTETVKVQEAVVCYPCSRHQTWNQTTRHRDSQGPGGCRLLSVFPPPDLEPDDQTQRQSKSRRLSSAIRAPATRPGPRRPDTETVKVQEAVVCYPCSRHQTWTQTTRHRDSQSPGGCRLLSVFPPPDLDPDDQTQRQSKSRKLSSAIRVPATRPGPRRPDTETVKVQEAVVCYPCSRHQTWNQTTRHRDSQSPGGCRLLSVFPPPDLEPDDQTQRQSKSGRLSSAIRVPATRPGPRRPDTETVKVQKAVVCYPCSRHQTWTQTTRHRDSQSPGGCRLLSVFPPPDLEPDDQTQRQSKSRRLSSAIRVPATRLGPRRPDTETVKVQEAVVCYPCSRHQTWNQTTRHRDSQSPGGCRLLSVFPPPDLDPDDQTQRQSKSRRLSSAIRVPATRLGPRRPDTETDKVQEAVVCYPCSRHQTWNQTTRHRDRQSPGGCRLLSVFPPPDLEPDDQTQRQSKSRRLSSAIRVPATRPGPRRPDTETVKVQEAVVCYPCSRHQTWTQTTRHRDSQSPGGCRLLSVFPPPDLEPDDQTQRQSKSRKLSSAIRVPVTRPGTRRPDTETVKVQEAVVCYPCSRHQTWTQTTGHRDSQSPGGCRLLSVFPPPDLDPDDQTQRQSKSRKLSSAIRVPATRPGTRRPDTETVKVQKAVVCYPCSRHQTWNQTTRHRDSQRPGGCRLLSVFPPPDLEPDDQTQRQSKSRKLSSAIRVPATRPGTRRPDTETVNVQEAVVCYPCSRHQTWNQTTRHRDSQSPESCRLLSVFPPPDLEPDDQTQRQTKSRRLSSAIRVPATRPGTRRPDTETVKVQKAVICYPCSRHQTWTQTTRHRDSQSPGGCRLLSVFPPPDLEPDDQTQRQSKSRRLSSAIRVPATRPGPRRPGTETVKVQEAVVCYPCSRHQTWNQTTRHRDSQSPGGCRLLSVFPPPDLEPDDQTQRQSKSGRLSSAIRVPATRPGPRRPDTETDKVREAVVCYPCSRHQTWNQTTRHRDSQAMLSSARSRSLTKAFVSQ